MKKVIAFYLSVVAVGFFLTWGGEAVAANEPQLHIRFNSTNVAGMLQDGAKIAEGRITLHSDITGFQVWSNALQAGSQPNRYVASGTENANHKLYFRLEKEGWLPDTRSGKGIVYRGSDNSVTFNILADGNQNVAADSYDLQISGNGLLE